MDYSIRGIAAGVASGVSALTKPFRTPDGYTPASATPAPAPAPAASPAPAAPQLGGVNLDAMKRREEAAGMKHGGVVKGPGTGTSDSIPVNVSKGEFIIPADTVKKIGLPTLRALVKATHRQVPPKAGAIRKMANGGMAKRPGYVNGDMPTDDDARKKIAAINPPAEAPPSYGQQMSNVGGAIANAAGTVLKTVVGAPGYGLNAITGASVPDAPAAAPAPMPRTDVQSGGAVRPISALAQAAPVATAPPAPRPTAPPAQPDGLLPGTITRIDTGSSPLFSNVTGVDNSALMARGAPSAQNVAAADAMSARYNPAPTETTAPGSAVTVLADTGGYGLRDKATLAARNAGGGDIRGLSSREIARQANARDIAAEQNATSRANNQDTNATSVANTQAHVGEQRYGADSTASNARARLALDTQTHSQDSTLKGGQIRLAAQTEAARAEWLNAKTPEAQVAAEEKLRVLQGKAEKTVPELYSTTAIPGGVDPATGMPKGAGAIVTNKRTGETKIISADEAKGTQAPKFEPGKVYQDAKGNKAKWDGSKFVPA